MPPPRTSTSEGSVSLLPQLRISETSEKPAQVEACVWARLSELGSDVLLARPPEVQSPQEEAKGFEENERLWA